MLVSIFIIAFSLVGIFNLNSKYNQQTLQEKESFIATLLAQEGIEIIKNMRDTNSLNDQCWTYNIDNTNPCAVTPPSGVCVTQGCEIDYRDTSVLTGWGNTSDTNDPPGGNYLYLNNGFYGYDNSSGVWTPYRRRIFISYPYVGDPTVEHKGVHIRSVVYWKGKKVEVRQEIFDWRSL